MNRNHLYFMNPVPVQAYPQEASPIVSNPIPCRSGYLPRLADPQHPRWFNNQEFVRGLGEVTRMTGYNSKVDGYHIDDGGYIYQPGTGNEGNGGVIAAMAVASEQDGSNDLIVERTHIVNTEDGGLRHVYITKNGSVMDIGPVENTCLIGNIARPEGIYVPLCNTRAMADGAVILENMIKQATENDMDLMPVAELHDDIEELPMGIFEDDHHECSCGGNCKCKKNK